MKIGEFLNKCNKEEIPFFLYCGTGNGYKIPCTKCKFLSYNKGIFKCESMFLSCCQDEFRKWLNEEICE